MSSGTRLFQSKPGTVKMLVPEGGITPGALFTWQGSAPGGAGGVANRPMPIVVTSVGYNQSINIQLMSTLKKTVYIYSFGDKVGDLAVSGLAFDRNCDNNTTGWGVDAMFKYYLENRAIKENQTITVTLGSNNITGLLVGMQLDLESVEFKTMRFTLFVKAFPKDVNKTVGGTPTSDTSAATNNTQFI